MKPLWFIVGACVLTNGSYWAVVYHDDTATTQIASWNDWVIDLQTFSGVDLTNVNTIAIGLRTENSLTAGGTGTMYFDDIRLVR